MESVLRKLSSILLNVKKRFCRIDYMYNIGLLMSSNTAFVDAKNISLPLPINRIIIITNFDTSKQIERNKICNFYQKLKLKINCFIINEKAEEKQILYSKRVSNIRGKKRPIEYTQIPFVR